MQIIERGCALLGYIPVGHMAFVVVATRVRPAATLPGGHLVRLVADSRWLQIPLQVILRMQSQQHSGDIAPASQQHLQSQQHFGNITPSTQQLDLIKTDLIWRTCPGGHLLALQHDACHVSEQSHSLCIAASNAHHLQ